MRAQVAMEYIIIVAFTLVVLVPFAIYLEDVASNFVDDNSLTIASNSVEKLGETVDWVYAQGEPAKLKVMILVPKNVEEVSFIGKTINWKVRTRSGVSDIYYNTVASLSGSLPTAQGYYYILIQAIEDGVVINVSSG